MAICHGCNQDTLEEGGGKYEICPVCYWEDDPVQNNDEYLAGGANYFCLAEHRAIYMMVTRILDRRLTPDVADELLGSGDDPNWPDRDTLGVFDEPA